MPYTGVLVGKSIKLSRLKVDSFRFEMLRALDNIADGIEVDFEKTFETFEEQPEFKRNLSLSKGLMVVDVFTEDINYNRLNYGTEEHIIEAKNAPNLVYKKGYTSKTVPRVIGSRQSSYAGPTRRRKSVIHPGFMAREFDKAIQKKWEPRALRRLEEAMRRATKASGHGR